MNVNFKHRQPEIIINIELYPGPVGGHTTVTSGCLVSGRVDHSESEDRRLSPVSFAQLLKTLLMAGMSDQEVQGQVKNCLVIYHILATRKQLCWT